MVKLIHNMHLHVIEDNIYSMWLKTFKQQANNFQQCALYVVKIDSLKDNILINNKRLLVVESV